MKISRRRFNTALAGGAGMSGMPGLARAADKLVKPPAYGGKNVIIIRYGGGVRRLETIDEDKTYSPYMRHVLAKRAVLFPLMEIAELTAEKEEVVTSHTEGTLHILTGKYENYKDHDGDLLGAKFEATVPTLFEYLRKNFDVPAHQALIVNGEDRKDEEYITFANHRLFGVDYRAEVLSLYRFKTYLLRRRLAEGDLRGESETDLRDKLKEMESIDYRRVDAGGQVPEIESFWDDWRKYWGTSGFKNPRGDRLLTELGMWAMKKLRPKLMMVNYQDPDYVHWGNASHYTRAIGIIDDGIRQLVQAVDNDPEYRDNTVFVIVPDCGRDTNAMMEVPYLHHFGTRSAHEIFAMVFGAGIDRNRVVDKVTDQSDIAATVGAVMGFKTPYAEGRVLEEIFA